MDNINLMAIRAAEKVRIQLNIGSTELIRIEELCSKLNVVVRYTDINMEGMYIAGEKNAFSTILLSNLRPLPRRAFTCAHELGHHIFNHGSKLDTLEKASDYNFEQKQEESLVDIFAGALLMPLLSISREFNIRQWKIQNSRPINFFIISSIFGVGYHTLITHCKANKLISNSKGSELLKVSPKKIFIQSFSSQLESSHFKIFDKYCTSIKTDLEENNFIVLPKKFKNSYRNIEFVSRMEYGFLYRALNSGIIRENTSGFSIEIRIQKKNYIGLAKYRFKEMEFYAETTNH